MNRSKATIAGRLIPIIEKLTQSALDLERDCELEIERIDLTYQASARNLLPYVAIGRRDL